MGNMAINGMSGRRLEAIKLAVRIEGMKAQGDRELDVDSIIEKAEKIDAYTKKMSL